MRAGPVWRALDRARALNLSAAGKPRARPSGDGLSRRRLLAAMGGGAAALSLPGCFRSPSTRRVAIVGGGLAGLVALDRLRAQGIDATLYEARAAVGGRTRSVRGVFAPNYAFDEGGQLVNGDHADMIALTKRLKLTLIDRRALGPKTEIQLSTKGKVDERALIDGLRSIAARIGEDSARLDKDWEKFLPEIDALTVTQYLDRQGMKSGDAREALEAAIRTEYGAEPDGASAVELLFNLSVVDGQALTRLSLSDERYLIDGGTAQVAQRLGELHRDAVRLGKVLKAVTVEEEDVAILHFADGEERSFDYVILALPASLLKTIAVTGPFPPLWNALIGEVDLGKNEKVIAGYDRTVWRDAIGPSGAFWSSDGFAEAWDAASTQLPADAPGAITYFLGGNQVAAAGSGAAEPAARFTKLVREAVPALGDPNGRYRRTRWCDEPYSKGAYINFKPGQLTKYGRLLTVEDKGEVRASTAGCLVFAGEWLSDAWPGYMNGAAQTGRLAADAVTSALKAGVKRAA